MKLSSPLLSKFKANINTSKPSHFRENEEQRCYSKLSYGTTFDTFIGRSLDHSNSSKFKR